jgi:hypothetical protein
MWFTSFLSFIFNMLCMYIHTIMFTLVLMCSSDVCCEYVMLKTLLNEFVCKINSVVTHVYSFIVWCSVCSKWSKLWCSVFI